MRSHTRRGQRIHGNFEQSRQFHTAGTAIAAMLLFQIVMRIAFLNPRFRSPILDTGITVGMAIGFALLLNG